MGTHRSWRLLSTRLEDRAMEQGEAEEKRWAALHRAQGLKVKILNSDCLGLNLNSITY